MAFTIDSNAVSEGMTGHLRYHRDISDLFTGMGAGLNVLNTAFAGGADPTGAADSTAAINAAETAAAAAAAGNAHGAQVIFPPGQYSVTGLTKQANTVWQGAGRNSTIIKLADGSNKDVVRGASFTTLTCTGSPAGIGGWDIRDMTLDGNNTGQSGTSYGLRVYGYDFGLFNVTIRSCLTDCLYTEWSSQAGGPSGYDVTMESRLYGVKLYTAGANGWHNRGPHDSRAYDLTIFGPGSGFPCYWGEGAPSSTVAAGSNGVDVATFAGAGTLNVNTTLNWPAASISSTQGAIVVTGLTGGTGTATITYTGTTATSFTGCTTVSGSGTLGTGNPATMTGGGYSAGGMLMYGAHTFGAAASWGFILDTSHHLVGCSGEVAATGIVLVRSLSKITGGVYFIGAGATQTGCGIQLGDTANAVSRAHIRTAVERTACTSASTAALNIVNDGTQNDVEIMAYAPGGSTVWAGTRAVGSRYAVWANGQSNTANAANSMVWDNATRKYYIPDNTAGAVTFQDPNGFADILNLSTITGATKVEFPNGPELRGYSDNYTTATFRVSMSLGHVGTAVKNGTSMSIAAAAGAGTSPPAPTLQSGSSDTQGQASMGTGTSPAAGAQATVTFANAFANAPVVVIAAANAATSALQPYVTTVGTTSFQAAFNVAPAASQASGTYLVNYHILARPT